jgi:hypothetical protein
MTMPKSNTWICKRCGHANSALDYTCDGEDCGWDGETTAAQRRLSYPSRRDKLAAITGHLGVALCQSTERDDAIIIGHIRTAHALVVDMLRHEFVMGNQNGK